MIVDMSNTRSTHDQADAAKPFFNAPYEITSPGVHILAMVLDPLICKSQYLDLIPCLNIRPILSFGKNVLPIDMKHVRCNQSDFENASRLLVLHVANKSVRETMSLRITPSFGGML